MRAVLFILCLAAFGCSKDSEPASPNGNQNQNPPHDSTLINTPPANFTNYLDGTWRHRHYASGPGVPVTWIGDYSIGGSTMLAETARQGTWNPILDLRVTGSRIWFDADPMLFPGNAVKFNGTLMGDSLVGWYRHLYSDSNGRWGGVEARPMVFYKIR